MHGAPNAMGIAHRSHSDGSDFSWSVSLEIDPNSWVTLKATYFSNDSRVSYLTNNRGERIFQFAHMCFGSTWIIAKVNNGVTHDLSRAMPGDIATSIGFDNGNLSGIQNVGHVAAPANGDDWAVFKDEDIGSGRMFNEASLEIECLAIANLAEKPQFNDFVTT